MRVFPEGGLDASVTTTVWVGVLVLCYLNLRLGWTFSGLVVPGYLVPLLIAKPAAAAVIAVEAVVAYALTWLVSEKISETGVYCNLFGRDRFFLIVLMSILVRLGGENWVLPAIGAWIEAQGIAFDYRSSLHSFGLIIVALLANQLWKPGLARGLFHFSVTLGLTWAAIRFVLIPATNFNVGSLEFMYEDIAASFLASPKSYIVLLTAGFVASQMNLRYSWDFNGILVPSLMALLVFQPSKLLTTFIESWVVLFFAQLVLQTPWLRQVSMENARKLRLFFNVSFAYKLILGWILALVLPEIKISDWYGFGYLLPTLMAVRMHDQGIAVRLSTVTFTVTAASGLIAGALGFSMTLLPSFAAVPERSGELVAEVRRSPQSVLQRLRADKLTLYGTMRRDSYEPPITRELDAFQRGVQALEAHLASGEPLELDRAAALLAAAGYRFDVLEGRDYYLYEDGTVHGWGLYVLAGEAAGNLVVEVPAPVEEWATLETGALLWRELGGRALAIGGAPLGTNRDGSANVLANPESIFQAFHRAVGSSAVLQVRGYTERVVRELGRGEDAPRTVDSTSSLWLAGRLPASLDLKRLEEILGPYAVETAVPRTTNRQRDATRTGFAELFLNRADRRRALTRAVRPAPDAVPAGVARREVDLAAWLVERKAALAGRGSGLFRPAELSDLLFFDDEVLDPLLALLARAAADPAAASASAEGRALLEEAVHAAGLLGYRVEHLRDREAGDEVLALVEDEARPERRHWGTYVFRLGAAAPYAVQVPRPLQERFTFDYGTHLFAQTGARALLLAGAHPLANTDGSADLIRPENKKHLFNLVHRELALDTRGAPLVTIQVRGYNPPAERPAPADLLFATTGSGPWIERLRNQLGEGGLSWIEVDGSAATAGYEAANLFQARYLELLDQDLVALWLSASARRSFRRADDSPLEEAHFALLGIASERSDLVDALSAERFAPLPAGARELLGHYLETGDVVALERLRRRSPLSLRRWIDRDTGQDYLALVDAAGRPAVAVRLDAAPAGASRDAGAAAELRAATPSRQAVHRFRELRAVWLLPEGTP